MNEDDVVWKYMDIRKLKSSIDNGGLWFSRADILRNSDPFEIENVDRIKYIDFNSEQQNYFILHKHNVYSFEKELCICRNEDVAVRFDSECG